MIAAAAIMAASLVVTARTALRPVAAGQETSRIGPAGSSASSHRPGVPVPDGEVDSDATGGELAETDEGPGSPGDDDLMTYAYVSTDLAALQSGLARTVTDAQALTSAADSWSL